MICSRLGPTHRALSKDSPQFIGLDDSGDVRANLLALIPKHHSGESNGPGCGRRRKVENVFNRDQGVGQECLPTRALPPLALFTYFALNYADHAPEPLLKS